MKKLILTCIIIGSLAFAACNRNAANQDNKYEITGSSSRVVTESEKSRAFEEHLIKRLQDTVETYIDNINEAIINIDSPSETEKNVNVLVITEPDTQLTDEEKEGIVRLIKNSVSNAVAVNLSEEQRTD